MAGEIRLTVRRCDRAATARTARARRLATIFGLAGRGGSCCEPLARATLTLRPGHIIFITGPSGGGKSRLLHAMARRLRRRGDVRLVEMSQGDRGSRHATRVPGLIDLLGDSLEHATRCLSLAGLADAAAMLRRPHELSEGQRHRWRLAQCIAQAEAADPGSRPTIVLADEFASTLDRLTAALVARHAARWARRTGVCLIAASAHDDLLEYLEPETLVAVELGGTVQVVERNAATFDVQHPTSNVQTPHA